MSNLTPPGPAPEPPPDPSPPGWTPGGRWLQQPPSRLPAPHPFGPFRPAPPPERPDSGLGWTGFGLSLAFCVPLLPAAGLVLGIVTLSRNRFTPRWVAVVAVVAGVLFSLLQVSQVPVVIDGIRAGMNASIEDAREDDQRSWDRPEVGAVEVHPGDCINDAALRGQLDDAGAVEADRQVERTGRPVAEDVRVSEHAVFVVPCNQPHDFEVYSELTVYGLEFPGAEAVRRRTEDCVPAFREFVEKPYARSIYRIAFYYPTAASWRLDDHRTVTCLVGHPRRKVVGTLRDIRR